MLITRTVAPEGYPYIGVNLSHSLARGMAEYYFLGRPTVWDAYRRKLCTTTFTGAAASQGPYGRSRAVANSAANVIKISGVAATPSSYTVAVICKMTSGAWGGFAGAYVLCDASNNSVLSLQDDGGGSLTCYHGGVNCGSLGTDTTVFTAGVWGVNATDYDGATVRMWKNGVRGNTSALATAPSGTADHWNVGNERTAGVVRPGDYALLVRWNRLLTSDEQLQFYMNPQAVLNQLPRYDYFGVTITGQIKTANALAIGNIKSFQGLAKANTKTVNGLTP